MNDINIETARRVAGSQRGFTLVELMISITVALFLLGGLLATVQSTRQAYTSQNLLAQLQDNERLAMTLMTDVISSAGYFPDPINNANATDTLFPADASFASSSQVIAGAANGAGPGDTITIRYAAWPNDNVYNCIGQQNTTGATVEFENTFWVNNQNQLVCTFNGQNYPLITSNTTAGVTTLGVQGMTIQYGIKANAASTGSCTDTYQTTAQMVATGNWGLVCSVRVTLTFANPVNAAKPISITRVIALMSRAGVNS